MVCLRAIFAELYLHSSLQRLVPELYAQLLVNSIELLRVDLPAVTRQQHVHAPKSEPDTGLAYLLDALFQRGLAGSTRRVAVGHGIEPDPVLRLLDDERLSHASVNFDAFMRFRSPPNQGFDWS